MTLETAKQRINEAEQILAATDRLMDDDLKMLEHATSLRSREYYSERVEEAMLSCISNSKRILKYAKEYNIEPSATAKAYGEMEVI